MKQVVKMWCRKRRIQTCKVPFSWAEQLQSLRSTFPRCPESFGILLHRTAHPPINNEWSPKYTFSMWAQNFGHLVREEEDGSKSTWAELLHHLVLLLHLAGSKGILPNSSFTLLKDIQQDCLPFLSKTFSSFFTSVMGLASTSPGGGGILLLIN